MFTRLFARRDPETSRTVDALYEQIVAAARQPVFYSDWQVPDTPLGRFEMLSLHMFLFLRRVRGEEGAMREVAQGLTDEFFRDVEHSLRELGVGDLSVPKRMKKLVRMFYGRVASYGDALDRVDQAALSAALARNVRPETAGWPDARKLASHVAAVAEALRLTEVEAFLQGRVNFAAERQAETEAAS